MGQSAIIIGQELIECKKEVPHGDWQNWLQDNFNLSYQTAAKFMQIAERFSNVPTSEHLATSQMFEMLSLPAEDTEKFIAEKAEEGKPGTCSIKKAQKKILQIKADLWYTYHITIKNCRKGRA